MPILDASDFQPSRKYRSAHYSTLVPYLFGSFPKIEFRRERIDTADGDFLDIDYAGSGSKKLAVILHGLEGNSSASYNLLSGTKFLEKGWDLACPNYRGCSGELNRRFQMYNSGTTDDLDLVLRHVTHGYETVSVIGISLGGNLVLKYAGEGVYEIPKNVHSFVSVSAPVHLSNASQALKKRENWIYQWNFLRTLLWKVYRKSKQFPGRIDTSKIWKTTNLFLFDEYFTAPMFGYASAEDYYSACMSIQFLDEINIPTLLLNAQNDPFLGDLCFPYEIADRSSHFHLCAPAYGGHVGFAYARNDRSYLVQRISSFVDQYVPSSVLSTD
ncbi:MAG: alpha/beta fold hydrolase [Bacteroidota bacterium]